MTADIESMFLQVQVPEAERSSIRFLWRSHNSEPVGVYEYQRHVFGAASSPTCANYALQRVGIDNKDQFPVAAKAIENNFYMDDFIKSFQTVEEGKTNLSSAAASIVEIRLRIEEMDQQWRID